MSEEKVAIKKIEEVFSLNLTIPNYQRPYKWTEKNVQQLIDDLRDHFRDNKEYRIGTIVLYENKENENFEIVDGQQRLITLSLLLYKLGYQNNEFLKSKLSHKISQSNIINNFNLIKMACSDLDDKEFRNYILKSCEFVTVVLEDLDECFQFFDSQNARGKPLESYDLLKAYHLREMKGKNKAIIHQCVERWEKSAISDEINNLDKVINYILFRLRRWHYQETGEIFTSEHLDTFKGVSEEMAYPYLGGVISSRLMQKMVLENTFISHKKVNYFGFQAKQALVNGEYFFDYIHYYTQFYADLFNEKYGALKNINCINKKALNQGLISFLDSYKNQHRVGDQYLRNLFECVVLSYVDKFGKDLLEEFVTKAFIWVYQIRFEHTRITFKTMEKKAYTQDGLLACIERAVKPEQVLRFKINAVEKEFKNIDDKIEEIMGDVYVIQK